MQCQHKERNGRGWPHLVSAVTLCLTAVSLCGCPASVRIRPLRTNETVVKGIVYYLPTTRLVVKVPCTIVDTIKWEVTPVPEWEENLKKRAKAIADSKTKEGREAKAKAVAEAKAAVKAAKTDDEKKKANEKLKKALEGPPKVQPVKRIAGGTPYYTNAEGTHIAPGKDGEYVEGTEAFHVLVMRKGGAKRIVVIREPISATPVVVPDNRLAFVITPAAMRRFAVAVKDAKISLSARGCLTGVNAEFTDQSAEIVSGLFTTAANVIKAGAMLGATLTEDKTVTVTEERAIGKTVLTRYLDVGEFKSTDAEEFKLMEVGEFKLMDVGKFKSTKDEGASGIFHLLEMTFPEFSTWFTQYALSDIASAAAKADPKEDAKAVVSDSTGKSTLRVDREWNPGGLPKVLVILRTEANLKDLSAHTMKSLVEDESLISSWKTKYGCPYSMWGNKIEYDENESPPYLNGILFRVPGQVQICITVLHPGIGQTQDYSSEETFVQAGGTSWVEFKSRPFTTRKFGLTLNVATGTLKEYSFTGSSQGETIATALAKTTGAGVSAIKDVGLARKQLELEHLQKETELINARKALEKARADGE
jgi:hypothetical protein